jgi:hypothetical protein
MTHISRLLALALSALSACPVFAAPQRTFVSSTGSDTNPCTLTSPCRGFQAAIDAVAAGGEVVAVDSAGYGAMEIHKSISVIVPPGVHASLSPLTGIALPGFPGQSTVVLIDIQSNDIVVLRGLAINHVGTVTGGIDWLSTNGGTVHVENVSVTGFPNEGLFMRAPGGKMYVKDSIFRNNGYGIYARGDLGPSMMSMDRVRIQGSTVSGYTHENAGEAMLRDSVVVGNAIGIDSVAAPGTSSSIVLVDRSEITQNTVGVRVVGNGVSAYVYLAATTIWRNTTPLTRNALGWLISLGLNSTEIPSLFNSTQPPQ